MGDLVMLQKTSLLEGDSALGQHYAGAGRIHCSLRGARSGHVLARIAVEANRRRALSPGWHPCQFQSKAGSGDAVRRG